jgi:type IV secretion system protein VirD4
LTVREPEPGRVILGRTPGLLGRLLAAEDCHSVLVFGPTGSYKTSALVIPAVLEWTGPLVATSVKPDLLRATLAHRARLGQVLVIDPLGASGVTAAKWSPLASCGTWAGAQQMAGLEVVEKLLTSIASGRSLSTSVRQVSGGIAEAAPMGRGAC